MDSRGYFHWNVIYITCSLWALRSILAELLPLLPQWDCSNENVKRWIIAKSKKVAALSCISVILNLITHSISRTDPVLHLIPVLPVPTLGLARPLLLRGGTERSQSPARGVRGGRWIWRQQPLLQERPQWVHWKGSAESKSQCSERHIDDWIKLINSFNRSHIFYPR